MRKIYIPAIIAVLLTTSCAKENSTKDGASYLSLSGKTLEIVPTKVNVPLNSGINIGVYVPNVTSGSAETLSSAVIGNKLFTVNSDGTIGGEAVYLSTGKDYDVYAYAPRATGTPLNPSSISFAKGTDVLWAEVNRTLRGVTAGKNTANLSFVHKTSQVKFTLLDNRDQSTKNAFPYSGATFEVSGFTNGLTLNLETGAVTPGAADNTIKITQQGTPLCFAPATTAMTLYVKVTIPGATSGEQIYTGAVTTTFLTGNSYSYNIKITTTYLDINGTLTDWIPVSAEDIVVRP